MLDLEHTMSDIVASGCANVDHVSVESLVEKLNEILLNAVSESNMFFTTQQGRTIVKKVKQFGLIGTVLSNVKRILKLEIQIGD